MLRHDIRKKFENAASPWKREQIDLFVKEFDNYSMDKNDGISYFKGSKVQLVPDYFELSGLFGC
jgi:hypothetical protein